MKDVRSGILFLFFWLVASFAGFVVTFFCTFLVAYLTDIDSFPGLARLRLSGRVRGGAGSVAIPAPPSAGFATTLDPGRGSQVGHAGGCVSGYELDFASLCDRAGWRGWRSLAVETSIAKIFRLADARVPVRSLRGALRCDELVQRRAAFAAGGLGYMMLLDQMRPKPKK
jgi:hypothetical protein